MSVNKIFHESWYRVADRHISLRAEVRVSRQRYRGNIWYVLHEPFSNQFFRITPEAYNFIARLNKHETVDETWNRSLQESPDSALGQGEIIELLTQLYQANLLYTDFPADSKKLFARYEKKRKQLMRSTLANILFSRIPLFDPDKLLQRFMPLIKLVISPIGMILWLIVVGLGVKVAIDNHALLGSQAQSVLAPSNIFLLYVSTVLVKLIHEIGHASAVRRFGGEVHTMGIMLMMLTPLPYVDATSAWFFKDKKKRIFVGFAGMIYELFVAAIAAIIWANTDSGPVHSIAYNVMFMASVTTLLFNINPLLRYDGYYILSDITDSPNLFQNGQKQITYIFEKFVFGLKTAKSVGKGWQESSFLFLYGISGAVYRIFVFSGIILFIANRYLLLGIIMTIISLISWAIVPLWKFFKYLFTSPKLYKCRSRAVSISLGAFIATSLFLSLVPFPCSFKTQGIIRATESETVITRAPGKIIVISEKSSVTVGDTLLVLENDELKRDIKATEYMLEETDAAYILAMKESPADLAPLTKKMTALQKRLEKLETLQKDLVVTASLDGEWVTTDIHTWIGRDMPRGTECGEIISQNRFEFISAVPQKEASELFAPAPNSAEVKLVGLATKTIPVDSFITIPMEKRNLASPILGFAGGGDMEVSGRDSTATETMEPFFEVTAALSNECAHYYLQGRSGKIRFQLPKRPLLQQGVRKLQQLIQKHYQI